MDKNRKALIMYGLMLNQELEVKYDDDCAADHEELRDALFKSYGLSKDISEEELDMAQKELNIAEEKLAKEFNEKIKNEILENYKQALKELISS